MGLDMLSTPIRLALVVALAILVVLMFVRFISRKPDRRNGVKKHGESDLVRSELDEGFVNAQVTKNLQEISLLSELMAKTAPSPEFRAQSNKIVRAAKDAQLALNNQVLVEKMQAVRTTFKPVAMDFEVLVKSVVMRWESIVDPTGIDFTWHLDKKIPSNLYIDPEIIRQMLNSLLTNSRDMTRQGRIHVHITGTNTSEHEWVITIIVADTGRGFPKSFKENVRSGKQNLTGVDAEQINVLAAQKMLQTMQGEMKISSVMERGTEITLTFPARAAIVTAREAHEAPEIRNPNGSNSMADKRVLIIEDDVSSQEVLKTFLAPEGCEIDCIMDGSMALDTLAQKAYDLVLMDVRMDGLDGIKTTQAIRSSGTLFSNIPIIAITADVDPTTNAKCMMAGADLFLNKPIGTKALFDGIRFVMDVGIDNRFDTVSA